MWNWLRRNADPIEAAGMLLTGVIAGIAAFVAYWQITTQWDLEHQKSARESLRNFQVMSLNHPHLANPYLRPLSDMEKEQYDWYIGLMNTTFEDVLSYFPDAEEWTGMMVEQIRVHCGHYNGDLYDPDQQTVRYAAIVEEALADTKELCKGPLDE